MKILNFIDKHIIVIVWSVFFIGNNPVVFNKGSAFLYDMLRLSWISIAIVLFTHLCIGLNFKKILKNLIAMVTLFAIFVVSSILFFLLAENIFFAEIILTFVCMLVIKNISVLLFTCIRRIYYYIRLKKLKTIFSIVYINKNNLKKIFAVALILNVMLLVVLIFISKFIPEWAGQIF